MVTRTFTAILGEGAVHVSQEVSFQAPVRIGDTITVVSEVTEKLEDRRRVIISSVWTNQDELTVPSARQSVTAVGQAVPRGPRPACPTRPSW